MIKPITTEFNNHYTQYASSYMMTSEELGGAGLKPTEYMVWMAYWIEYRNRRTAEYVYCLQCSYDYIATKIGMSRSSVKTASQSLQKKGLLFQFKVLNDNSWWIPVDPTDRAYYTKTIDAMNAATKVRTMRKSKVEVVETTNEVEEEITVTLEEVEIVKEVTKEVKKELKDSQEYVKDGKVIFIKEGKDVFITSEGLTSIGLNINYYTKEKYNLSKELSTFSHCKAKLINAWNQVKDIK